MSETVAEKVNEVTEGFIEEAKFALADQGVAADDDAMLEDAFAAIENALTPLLTKIKIVVGYAQITSFMADVFTIDWPSATITELGNTYMVPPSAVNFCAPFPW